MSSPKKPDLALCFHKTFLFPLERNWKWLDNIRPAPKPPEKKKEEPQKTTEAEKKAPPPKDVIAGGIKDEAREKRDEMKEKLQKELQAKIDQLGKTMADTEAARNGIKTEAIASSQQQADWTQLPKNPGYSLGSLKGTVESSVDAKLVEKKDILVQAGIDIPGNAEIIKTVFVATAEDYLSRKGNGFLDGRKYFMESLVPSFYNLFNKFNGIASKPEYKFAKPFDAIFAFSEFLKGSDANGFIDRAGKLQPDGLKKLLLMKDHEKVLDGFVIWLDEGIKIEQARSQKEAAQIELTQLEGKPLDIAKLIADKAITLRPITLTFTGSNISAEIEKAVPGSLNPNLQLATISFLIAGATALNPKANEQLELKADGTWTKIDQAEVQRRATEKAPEAAKKAAEVQPAAPPGPQQPSPPEQPTAAVTQETATQGVAQGAMDEVKQAAEAMKGFDLKSIVEEIKKWFMEMGVMLAGLFGAKKIGEKMANTPKEILDLVKTKKDKLGPRLTAELETGMIEMLAAVTAIKPNGIDIKFFNALLEDPDAFAKVLAAQKSSNLSWKGFLERNANFTKIKETSQAGKQAKGAEIATLLTAGKSATNQPPAVAQTPPRATPPAARA